MIEHMLRASLERNLPVTIIYMNEGGVTQRDIKVIDINRDYIRAYCFLRKEIRIFAKGSILSAYWCRNKRAV